MEFGEMKRNTSNWSNFCMLLRRAGFTASAGLSCLTVRGKIWHIEQIKNFFSLTQYTLHGVQKL